MCYTGTNLLLIGLAVVALGLLIMLAAMTVVSAGLAVIGAVWGHWSCSSSAVSWAL